MTHLGEWVGIGVNKMGCHVYGSKFLGIVILHKKETLASNKQISGFKVKKKIHYKGSLWNDLGAS